jgi:hypothetical protein
MSLAISEGQELRVGDAIISFSDGELIMKDKYHEERLKVRGHPNIVVEPIPPLYIPKRLTDCLVLALRDPILMKGEDVLRLTAPYELRVIADNTLITRLSPFKVKYTVIGHPAEGEVCRWYPTELVEGENEANSYIEVSPSFNESAKISGLIVEDVNVLPMRSEVKEGRFSVVYGPVPASLTNDYLIVEGRGALSRLRILLKVMPGLEFVRGP